MVWKILSFLFFALAAVSRADWTPITRNGYTYFQQANTTAYPLNGGAWYYVIEQVGMAEFQSPDSLGRYTRFQIRDTDGDGIKDQMWCLVPEKGTWVMFETVDLENWTTFLKTAQQAYQDSMGKPHEAYYFAKYMEAKKLYETAVQISNRNKEAEEKKNPTQ